MNDQQIILACDEQGNFEDYIPKRVGHSGKGRRHLAITVLLINNQGEVLLQKRKHQIFDNVWDFTASTHPLHLPDGTDETIEQATLRALKDEYDIDNISLKRIGELNYFASYPTKEGEYCENEHDHLLIGEYNQKVHLNPKVGYEYKWVKKGQMLKDMEQHPQNYTPWAQAGLKLLKQTGFV